MASSIFTASFPVNFTAIVAERLAEPAGGQAGKVQAFRQSSCEESCGVDQGSDPRGLRPVPRDEGREQPS
jgi:hypothetical protein